MKTFWFVLMACLFAAGTSLAETIPATVSYMPPPPSAPGTPQSKRCPFPTNYSNDGPWSMNGYSNWVETSMNNVDTYGADHLNGYATEWSDPSCIMVDGRPRLSGMLNGFHNSIYQQGKDWNRSLARIEKLKAKYPNAPVSAIAEAHYWFKYAWEARGSGYSSTITNEGMKLMHERLRKAEKVLNDSKPYASALPIWYELMLSIRSAQGAPQKERDTLLLEGVQRFKWYLPIYFNRAQFLAPWWGGSWDEIENLALWSAEQTKSEFGNAMYARVYWSVSGYTQVGNIFKDTKASWVRMKNGFEDLMKRYPNSAWNLHAYARFACDAGDKSTYLKLRKQLSFSSREMEEAWPKNGGHEVCDAKFGYKG